MEPTTGSVEVWADWRELGDPARMGRLFAAGRSRGRSVFGFEYDAAWLAGAPARAFDPALLLDPRLGAWPGVQYPAAGSPGFGLFLDSAPDRWGRGLMDRRERLQARREGRPVRALDELDYLLGVHDAQRMGALRFRLQSDSPFLADSPELAAPPLARIRELERACRSVEEDRGGDSPDQERWLRQLIGPGSSLGGARPKAGVRDEAGRLWIAKFPSRGDAVDAGAWEAVVHRLAQRAKLDVPEARCERFASAQRTFLTKRFDRDDQDRRVHFASAMTLLERRDGDDAAAGASYLELAELLVRHGADTKRDLEELWRRIVFSIAVSNGDDHLRNHGFLLTAKGWRLSPAYDINPDPRATRLSLAIDEVDDTMDPGLALGAAEHYRVKPGRAREILVDVLQATSGWRKVARELGIARAEVDILAPAFDRARP